MNRYERYKDSGIPWLGEVPEHWIIMPIKFSLTMPITDGPHETPEILSDGIPFISAEAVKNDKLDFNKKRGYISEEDNARFSRKYSPQKGDIYMVKSGATTGNVAKVETDEVFNIWSPLAVMRPNKNKISTDFLFYAIKSDYFNTSVQLKWNMGTQQNIGMGILSNIRVVIPPTDEQTAITHYLDTKLGEIDALIDKQQTLLEKLAEQRTAVITHAVTKGLNPAAPMKNSGVEWLGDVPAHWDVSPFKLVMNSIIDYRGKTPEKTNSGVFLITARNIKNGIIDYTLSQEFIDEDNYEEVMRRGLPKLGQVLMTTEAPLGEVAQIDRTDVALAQRVLKFDGKKDKLDNRFLKYFILSKAFQASLYKFATGSTALGIKSERLSYLKSLLPPVTEQINIANYLDQETVKIDRLCDTVNQTIGRLKEYRTALITQAVTGKIKVTDE